MHRQTVLFGPVFVRDGRVCGNVYGCLMGPKFVLRKQNHVFGPAFRAGCAGDVDGNPIRAQKTALLSGPLVVRGGRVNGDVWGRAMLMGPKFVHRKHCPGFGPVACAGWEDVWKCLWVLDGAKLRAQKAKSWFRARLLCGVCWGR